MGRVTHAKLPSEPVWSRPSSLLQKWQGQRCNTTLLGRQRKLWASHQTCVRLHIACSASTLKAKPKQETLIKHPRGLPLHLQQKSGASEAKRAQKSSRKPEQWKTNVETDRQRGDLSKRQSKRAKGDTLQRLAKVIAQAGIASRRKSEDLVEQGSVKVNGRIVTVPQHMVLPSVDEILIDGKPLPKSSKKYYFALNKPKGYLCSNQSFKEQVSPKLVVDLFKAWIEDEWKTTHPHPNANPPRLFTVGRLDVQSTGLIFVTNDGEWAQNVQHPSKNVTKEYVVTYSRVPTKAELEKLGMGCEVDGAYVQPVSVVYAAPDRKDKFRIIVSEGRNREVRVLSENAGLIVTGLKRVRIGGYRIPKDLGIGEFRELKPFNIKKVTDKGAAMNPQLRP